jgi:hypothetical protein
VQQRRRLREQGLVERRGRGARAGGVHRCWVSARRELADAQGEGGRQAGRCGSARGRSTTAGRARWPRPALRGRSDGPDRRAVAIRRRCEASWRISLRGERACSTPRCTWRASKESPRGALGLPARAALPVLAPPGPVAYARRPTICLGPDRLCVLHSPRLASPTHSNRSFANCNTMPCNKDDPAEPQRQLPAFRGSCKSHRETKCSP